MSEVPETMTPDKEVLIDAAIPRTKFACDLSRCKGGCCTMHGRRGAPLREEELDEIRRLFPVITKYLSEEHVKTIKQDGMFQGLAGDYTTQVVKERACAFVSWEGEIATCAFEKAFLNAESRWWKPLSCHLYPIRIDPGIPERLRFEYIRECETALERGESEHIRLTEFLESPLIRAYGKEWVVEFKDYCRHAQQCTTIEV